MEKVSQFKKQSEGIHPECKDQTINSCPSWTPLQEQMVSRI